MQRIEEIINVKITLHLKVHSSFLYCDEIGSVPQKHSQCRKKFISLLSKASEPSTLICCICRNKIKKQQSKTSSYCLFRTLGDQEGAHFERSTRHDPVHQALFLMHFLRYSFFYFTCFKTSSLSIQKNARKITVSFLLTSDESVT